MMNNANPFDLFRVWLSRRLLQWAVRVNPDPYLKSRILLGIQFTANLIHQEVTQSREDEMETAYDNDQPMA